MNENKSKEEIWKEESKAEGSKYFGNERWNFSGEFNFRYNFINGYLAGRKAGQEEVEKWKRCNETNVQTCSEMDKEISQLKSEIERTENHYKDLINRHSDENRFFKDENQKLKELVSRAKELFNRNLDDGIITNDSKQWLKEAEEILK